MRVISQEKGLRAMPEWMITDQKRTPIYMQYGAGGAQHPETLMWQLWVTFDGQHINWVAAYRNQSKINVAMQQIQEIGGQGDLFDEARVTAVLNRLYDGREAEPQPMPGEIEDVIRYNMRVGAWKV
jgi:hypothetical protein